MGICAVISQKLICYITEFMRFVYTHFISLNTANTFHLNTCHFPILQQWAMHVSRVIPGIGIYNGFDLNNNTLCKREFAKTTATAAFYMSDGLFESKTILACKIIS